MPKRLPAVHRYSIKDIEILSGIKAHTLRIWEQRYDILKPQRTDTNIRYYTDEELRFILNVAVLNQNRFKISKIVDMSKEEIEEEVMRITSVRSDFESQINAITLAMINLDEESFEKIFHNNVTRIGFEEVIVNIIYPFLIKVGNLWITNSIRPLHEHFICNLIRHRIIIYIESLPRTIKSGAKKFLLFTPEKEMHELSLLFSYFLLRSRKQEVLYIGLNVPLHDLMSVFNFQKPDYIVTAITTNPSGENLNKYLHAISHHFDTSKIIVSGGQMRNYKHALPGNILNFNGLTDYINYVDNF